MTNNVDIENVNNLCNEQNSDVKIKTLILLFSLMMVIFRPKHVVLK